MYNMFTLTVKWKNPSNSTYKHSNLTHFNLICKQKDIGVLIMAILTDLITIRTMETMKLVTDIGMVLEFMWETVLEILETTITVA